MPVSRLKNDKQPVRNKCQPTSANMLAARARPNPNISRFSPPHPARMHEFVSAGGPYAVVTVGRVVGIFPNSGVAMAQTVGVPDGALLNLKTWYGALGYYTSEYFAGQCAVIRVQEPPSTTATTTPLAPFPMEPVQS
ncbi:hypothetical protein NLJ89_g12334 [Agrocybe chaxingu]|uniref:Uncharacterized protein n=1 Tax=Agrocybe chaxingu TaxID=84603 RepID=A0A9W8JM24_9AGAR|nr:hypothetical protein NLJ89_g12334 [Agrocybe chaxingu]